MISWTEIRMHPDWAVAAALISFLGFFVTWSRKPSIAHIRGPPSRSRLLGNAAELLRAPAYSLLVDWQEQYGLAYRVPAVFGQERLVVADPKALQTVYSSTSLFTRPFKSMWRLYLGFGVFLAEGDTHKRHRKIMNPAFAAGPIKALVPLFTHVATTLGTRLKGIIEDSKDETAVIDVVPWMARTALDFLGNAAFDYHFNALHDDKNELARAYRGLLLEGESQPSDGAVLFRDLIFRLPDWASYFILKYTPSRAGTKIRDTQRISRGVARGLIDKKMAARARGEELAKDVMTLMIDANQSEDPKNRMDYEELMAQMSTLIIAGHDTTSFTLVWTLYCLAQQPTLQSKVREEIATFRERALQRGDTELAHRDYEAMVYLNAVIKEALRRFPAGQSLDRVAAVDTVIPLSRPITTRDGRSINEIPVRKGQFITASLVGYNLSKELWGPDAREFRPERWLEDREAKGGQIGIYSGLMSFATGPRGCIGWRFAVLEMQTVLVELLSTFEFSIPQGAKPIRAEIALAAMPIIEDEREKGAQMPLAMRIVGSG